MLIWNTSKIRLVGSNYSGYLATGEKDPFFSACVMHGKVTEKKWNHQQISWEMLDYK